MIDCSIVHLLMLWFEWKFSGKGVSDTPSSCRSNFDFWLHFESWEMGANHVHHSKHHTCKMGYQALGLIKYTASAHLLFFADTLQQHGVWPKLHYVGMATWDQAMLTFSILAFKLIAIRRVAHIWNWDDNLSPLLHIYTFNLKTRDTSICTGSTHLGKFWILKIKQRTVF